MAQLRFDGLGRPLDVDTARTAITRICRDRGHIDDYTRDQISRTDPDFQADFHRRVLREQETYARYTKTVAEQLYSSRFRLIYELLQNADDARYDENVDPTITFRVKPTALVIESNEQGFSLKDVQAICDTGKSSKIANKETTGEKGLGFKSVFGIADHVYIQSGLWSFRFEHKEGQDGVGMITPIWTDALSSLPPHVGTRCVLRYTDNSICKRVISEFENLPKTVIFALRQLSRLVVVIEDVDGRSDQIKFTKNGNLNSEEMQIATTISGKFGEHKSETTRLRLCTNTVSDLPKQAQRTDTTSAVTVAFEVTSSGLPVIPIRGQHVFAFLPVQRLPQLPFLIHANFVLAASRETVPDTDWNQALRKGIVSAFIDFVLKVVRPSDDLELTWMRFLPKRTIEGFWEGLYDEIKAGLQGKDIVKSRRDRLHTLAHVKVLPHWFCYANQPLLPDTDADIYLSGDYKPNDVKALEELGLTQIDSSQILTRVNLGLSAKGEKRIYDIPLNDSWHTAFTGLIAKLLQNRSVKSTIQSLEIIPLNNGNWASPSSLLSEAVYFPYIVDEDSVKIEVPEGLGLRKLHPTAAIDGERVNFYTSLGITSCPPDVATQKILEAHKNRKRQGNIFVFMSDLEILFWFGKPGAQSSIHHEDLGLVSDQNLTHQGNTLFFPSNAEYDSQRLLASTPRKDLRCYGILASQYMESQVREHRRHNVDWLSWLQKCGITYFPSLTQVISSRHVLHPLMSLIARDNPNSFVANLRAHWHDYRLVEKKISKEERNVLTQKLRAINVPCENGSTKPLSETLLPAAKLLEKGQELNLKEALPFLKLPEYDDQDSDTWSFLSIFGVTCGLNAGFYLAALRLMHDSTEAQLVPVCTRVYAGIAQTTNIGETDRLKGMFSRQPWIRTHTITEAWSNSTECIWEGPKFLQAKKALSPIYRADPHASSFFKTILSMRNVEYGDLILELQTLAARSNNTSVSLEGEVREIYTVLAGMMRSELETKNIREAFNSTGLIFAGGKWLKPSECLWNCAIAISGRVPLEQLYPKLKDFFVTKLRVTTMNINVLVHELTNTAKKVPLGVAEIKRIMIAIGQLLAADSNTKINEQTLKNLKETAFLPVRCPDSVRLYSVDQTFFINDHNRYGQNFKKKARIMDFEHEDLSSLHPFFELLGIRHRYLSKQVSPNTVVHKSTPNEDLRQYIRDRAYAFSCCANSRNSFKYFNKATSMHQKLLDAEVFVCEEMWTELTVRQDEITISVRSDRAVMKIIDADKRLELYVPSDHDGLNSCFHTELPGEVRRLLGIQDRAAEKVIYRILNDAEKDLETIMKDEDITGCPWFEKPISPTRLLPQATTNGNIELSTTSMASTPESSHDSEARLVRPVDQHSSSNAANSLLYANNVPAPTTIRPSPRGSVCEEVARTVQYRKLLVEVVRQAKKQGQSLLGGSLSLSEANNVFDEPENAVDYREFYRTFGGSTTYGTFEESARIGAAGELFVFELLKSSGVLNFTIDNWRSSIRDYVKVLPDYQDVPKWDGFEVSDVMYEGHSLQLMHILLKNSVSPAPAWLDDLATALPTTASGSPVNYHIEVKTTSGPRSTPFFMSKYQYKLMREKAYDPSSTTVPRNVFILMRVFNLFSGRIGWQVYINPWHLRESALEFVADPWKVVPC